MKKTLLLAAALACSGAVAQDKEVWACQPEASAALFWRDGQWVNRGMIEQNLLLTINADRKLLYDLDNEKFHPLASWEKTGIAKFSEKEPIEIYCVGLENNRSMSCQDLTLSLHFHFDYRDGDLGVAALGGATDYYSAESPYRDTVHASVYNCTKF
jgi:hypothetical protein|tara:strand:- start:14 stop:481 length:468 start_codon:yes stop_codon:yes gene_type:complete